jgi:predicted ATP-dependent protease
VRHRALAPAQLRWRCDPRSLGGPSTLRIPPDDAWFGDERARDAVLLALSIGGPHHHLLLRATAGTEPRRLLRQCMEQAEPGRAPSRDLVYVERFDRPSRPRLLELPPGAGQPFVQGLDAVADEASKLGGCAQTEALSRIRATLATVRASTHDRGARQHLAALRKRLIADLPTLRRADEPDEGEVDLYRAKLLHAAPARPPMVELPTVDARTLLGATDGHDDAPSVLRLTPGALLEADGGVCIVPAEPLLAEPALLRRLVATLRANTLHLTAAGGSTPAQIEDYRPDPIPLDTRVVVVGVRTARMAPLREAEAQRVFGVVADCGPTRPWTDDCGAALAGYLSHVRRREGLAHLRAAAIARLVEAQVREAEGRSRISCRTGPMVDRYREAELLARSAGSRFVEEDHVVEALARRRWRASRAEEAHRQRLARKRLRVRTTGTAVGTVNGLLVYTIDGHRYGAPARITATTAVGREGVINIEREAKLSGKTYDKGIYELVGLMRSRFCQRDPLGMVAMLTCEQSNGRIDGDSAAAAELVAIVTRLAGAPVKQGIAITGSISQRGELQSVGGVNEKIEGFFATCRDRGLEKGQGVIIPAANVEDLVLDDDVVRAAREGVFNVWAVDSVDAALQRMTGVPAGAPGDKGRYPPKTLMGRAQRRLEQMSHRLFPPRKGGGGAGKPRTGAKATRR